MTGDMQRQIAEFGRLLNCYNKAYDSAVESFNMSAISLRVLSVLREYHMQRHHGGCMFKELVDLLPYHKESVYLAVKRLERDGYVTAERMEGNRRNRIILLTAEGVELARNTADRIVSAENAAFRRLSLGERKKLLHLLGRVINAHREEMEKAISAVKEE